MISRPVTPSRLSFNINIRYDQLLDNVNIDYDCTGVSCSVFTSISDWFLTVPNYTESRCSFT